MPAAATTVGGQTRNRLAALDATSGAATAWNPNASSAVNALAVTGGVVYAGGLFTTVGGQPRSRLAALDASSGAATAWNPNANSLVNALAVAGGVVYAGASSPASAGRPAIAWRRSTPAPAPPPPGTQMPIAWRMRWRLRAGWSTPRACSPRSAGSRAAAWRRLT